MQTVAHGELGGVVVARAQRALVAGGGGGQVRLDGQQVRVLYSGAKKPH